MSSVLLYRFVDLNQVKWKIGKMGRQLGESFPNGNDVYAPENLTKMNESRRYSMVRRIQTTSHMPTTTRKLLQTGRRNTAR